MDAVWLLTFGANETVLVCVSAYQEYEYAGCMHVIAIAAADTLLDSLLNPDQLQQCNCG